METTEKKMSEYQSFTSRNRYLPTRENFILRMKQLLCDLADQASTIREQSGQGDASPPSGQQRLRRERNEKSGSLSSSVQGAEILEGSI